jgi:hypothetical protein
MPPPSHGRVMTFAVARPANAADALERPCLTRDRAMALIARNRSAAVSSWRPPDPVSLLAMRPIVSRRNGKPIVQFRGSFHQIDADRFELLRGGQMRAIASEPDATVRLLAQV